MDFSGGFTLRWRSLWKYGYHEDPLLFVMVNWFIDHAAWEDRKVFTKDHGLLNLKRGQVVYGRDQLAKFLKTSPGKVRARANLLKEVGFLTTRTTNKGTIATIVNYDKYQDPKLSQINKQPAEQPAEQPTNDQQTTTNKEYKEIKEKYSCDSIEVQLSQYLWNLILERWPNKKKPNIQKWARNIDLMIRIDKRTPEEIKSLIGFSQQDDFWQDNILSTSKLRKQFEKLWGQYKKSDYRRMIDEYTYNNPIWHRILSKNKLNQEQIDAINEGEAKRKSEREKANKAAMEFLNNMTPKQREEHRQKCRAKIRALCQKR